MQWQDFLEHYVDYAEISDAYQMAFKALEQMDALDKIRAEIEEPLKINEGMHTESAKAQAIALSWCIEIIDKYRGDANEVS